MVGGQSGPTNLLPVFGPSTKLDIEAEVGFVVGTPSSQGTPVPVAAFRDHIEGRARDLGERVAPDQEHRVYRPAWRGLPERG